MRSGARPITASSVRAKLVSVCSGSPYTMSMLMSSNPTARARSTSQRVCNVLWWRWIASWTASEKSCTPMLSERNPPVASTSTWADVVVRGSSSIERRASGAIAK